MLTALALTALVGSAIASPLVSSTEPIDLFRKTSGCSTSGPTSCHNTTSVKDTCCFESPGGLLLQTQFWDTDPATGPDDSWTIHGLWPDNCDGTYTENCDPKRAYTDISTILSDAGASSTLDYMKQYWVDINGQDEQFWAHEWSTHGTCYSTLEPSCLPSSYKKGDEAVDFFKTVVGLFKTLPTYEFLSKAGITPSDSKSYDFDDVLAALKKNGNGAVPAVSCSSGKLSAISWYYNLKGSLIDGEFVAIDSPQKSTCSGSIKYPTKSS